MTRVTVVLKTNEGGMWILPQVREMQERGANVTVVVPGGPGRLRSALDKAGVPVVEAGMSFSFRPRPGLVMDLLRLRRRILRTRPDVVLYHLYASALAVRLATLGIGLRRVHMVAGPLYLESAWIRRIERLLSLLDSHIIAGSRYTAESYRKLGVPASKLSSIPYGVDTARFTRGVDRRTELFACAQDTFVAVMVAYVYAPKSAVFPGVGIKGHDVILEAWSRFVVEHPDSLLVLVGSGFGDEGERHREKLLAQYEVENRKDVLWLSSVEDVRPIYSSADVSVSPSLSENHGAALEASAMSVPSIVSDAGALPETVNRESGWLVPAGSSEALLAALHDVHARWAEGTLGEAARAARSLAERAFSHDTVVPAVADVVLRRPPLIIAFTEQRVWRDGLKLRGRKPLPKVAALAGELPVALAARVAGSGPQGDELAPGSLPLPIEVAAGPRALAKSARAIWVAARRARILYADQPGIVGALALGISVITRRPLVVNVVGDSEQSVHPDVIAGLKGRVAHLLLPWLQRRACARAALANYVPSSELMRKYPAQLARGVFVSTTACALGPSRARAFPKGTASLVTVASLDQPYKGVEELIKAAAACTPALPLRLTVVGDGRLRPSLEVLARRELGIDVRFTGQLYGSDLYDEIGRHDLLVLASWTEGLPRALVEAMLDGLPALAASVGGVPDLLQPEHCFPPRDPDALARTIRTILTDKEAWAETVKRNAEAARRVVERSAYDNARFLREIVDLANAETQ